MAIRKNKKKGKMLLLLYDGVCWHGGVSCSNGKWEQKSESAKKRTILPDSLLQWGLSKGASLVRIAVPSELYELSVESGTDLTLLNPAELYETLCYELSEKTGLEPEDVAPLAVTFPSLKLGSNESNLIAAGFEREVVREYKELCEQDGLVFDGVTSLQALALAQHATSRVSPKEGIIFFGKKEAFVAGIFTNDHSFSFRTLSGSDTLLSQNEGASQRLSRRIKGFLGHPLHAVVAAGDSSRVEEAICAIEECELRVDEFPDLYDIWMKQLSKALPYMLEGSVGLAKLPPKVKDDKYVGGVICAAMILLTVFSLAGLWGAKIWQKYSLENLKTEIAALESAQKSAEGKFNSVQKQFNDVKRLHRLLGISSTKVEGSFSEILASISENAVRYTRFERIEQQPDGKTLLAGITLWPQEVGKFTIALQEDLRALHLSVNTKEMVPESNSDKTRFILEIR